MNGINKDSRDEGHELRLSEGLGVGSSACHRRFNNTTITLNKAGPRNKQDVSVRQDGCMHDRAVACNAASSHFLMNTSDSYYVCTDFVRMNGPDTFERG